MNSLVSNTRGNVGIAKAAATLTNYVGSDAYSWGYHSGDGNKYDNGNTTSYGNSYTSSDVIGVAFDADNGKLFVSKNGTWQASGDPVAGTNAAFTGLTSGPYFPATSFITGTGGASSISCNHGQRAFAYTAPSGFKALCTQNLPAPLVTKSNTVFDVVTRAGGGTTQTFATLRPGLVWEKRRDSSSNHYLFDVNRGNDNYLSSNLTSAEAASAGAFTFNTNSYIVSSGFDWPGGATVVDWVWDAGTSTVSNTQGSITSQVRANATAGFSVVKYTTVGSTNSTVGHGLGVAPRLLIVRYINQVSGWFTYHADAGAGNYLQLQTTGAASALSSLWNNTTPTSTVFSIGTAWTSSVDTIAYCFSPVVGYSSFGSWAAAAPPVFVYTGFRPAFVLAKSTTTLNPWYIRDNKRSAVGNGNPTQYTLFPNTSQVEGDDYYDYIDFVSNGFVIRAGSGGFTNIGTMIYAAFAEAPFQYARAR
jgi:hypothetical protein